MGTSSKRHSTGTKALLASLAFGAASGLAVGPATADPGFYAGLSLGAASPATHDVGDFTANTNTGADMSLYLGYDFGQVASWGGLRADVQFSGQAAEVSGSSDAEYLAGANFVTLYADYNPTGDARWVPYAGFGVGHGSFEFKDYQTSIGGLADDTGGAWGAQAVLGVSYHATENVRLFADVRNAAFADVEVTDGAGETQDVSPHSTSLNLGLAYHF